jgi:hypothetical protein
MTLAKSLSFHKFVVERLEITIEKEQIVQADALIIQVRLRTAALTEHWTPSFRSFFA